MLSTHKNYFKWYHDHAKIELPVQEKTAWDNNSEHTLFCLMLKRHVRQMSSANEKKIGQWRNWKQIIRIYSAVYSISHIRGMFPSSAGKSRKLRSRILHLILNVHLAHLHNYFSFEPKNSIIIKLLKLKQFSKVYIKQNNISSVIS